MDLTTGRTWTGPARFAQDGIDELLTGFFSRARGRLRSDPERTLVVTAEADGRTTSWRLYIGPDRAQAERLSDEIEPGGGSGAGLGDCAVRGPATAVYLALWNRAPLSDLEVTGDAGLLELWTAKATVRWT